MYALTITGNHFKTETKKALRILLVVLAIALTVGTLDVKSCSNDSDESGSTDSSLGTYSGRYDDNIGN